MTVTTTFTYLPSGFVFEFVKYEDGSVRYNLMPDPAAAAPVAPPPEASPLESPPVPAAAPEPSPAPVCDTVVDEMTLAAAPTKRRRTLWGFIRGAWFVLFTVVGEALTYALNNLTALNLPPGTATAIGAVGYGLKRGLWPDTTL